MLKQKIKESRDIKDNSLTAYITTLQKLHTTIKTTIPFNNVKWMMKKDKIKKHLENLKLTTRKNYLTSIIVALSTEPTKYKSLLKYYRDTLDNTAKEYNEVMKTQELSDTQKENWTTMSELNKIKTKLSRKKAKIVNNGLENITKKEFVIFQEYLVACLYLDMPPLRNDYAGMDIITDEEYKTGLFNENYLVVAPTSYYFVLNNYKTDKVYGTKIIDIPEKLNTTLTQWIQINPTKHFLLNNKGEPMTPNTLTKFLNSVFSETGKKISSSLIRHIYLSERYSADISQKETDANALLHSVDVQQGIYVKKQPDTNNAPHPLNRFMKQR